MKSFKLIDQLLLKQIHLLFYYLYFTVIEKQCIQIRLHSFKIFLLCVRVELSTLMLSFRSIRTTILS